MAKDAKKTTAFGTSPDSFNESRRRQGTEEVSTSTHDYTHNHTHTHAHGIQEPQARERKTKRVQLLTYESLIARTDAYAEKRGVKRVEVVEAALTAFLDSVEKADT